MAYLTCTKHRSYQRKHIDVCRQCPSNDGCDAFQTYAATEPPTPVEPSPAPEPAETNFSINQFLQEISEIRKLVTNTPALQETGPVSRQEKHLQGIKLVDFIRSGLEGIKKLC